VAHGSEPSARFILSAAELLGRDRLEIAPSCSLLHVPVDLDQEERLDPEVRGWMAFAKQKLEEVSVLVRAVNRDDAALGQIRATNSCTSFADRPGA